MKKSKCKNFGHNIMDCINKNIVFMETNCFWLSCFRKKDTTENNQENSIIINGSQSNQSQILSNAPPALKNKGEICYMNSIIQALGSCIKMREDLKKLQNHYKSEKLKQFVKLLNALNSPNAQKEFDDFTSSYGWTKNGQQDSFEMMIYFMNLIYNELEAEEKERYTDKDIIPFNQYWKCKNLPCRINMNSRTQCNCETDNKNILNDLALHLPLVNEKDENSRTYDIHELIASVLRVDPVDDNCDKCDASQTLVISLDGKPPRTLCFHIQANKYNRLTDSMTKPEYILDYPFEIMVQNQLYNLVSFVEHSGDVSVGHYVAYRKFEDEWFSVNDFIIEKLEAVSDPAMYCKKPYVLFYEAV